MSRTPGDRTRWWDAAVLAVLVLLLLGPAAWQRGYALRGDMVFVPDQPWKDAWLGLDGAAPRFVPGDAVVWALDLVLPGDLVQKLLLAGAFLLLGWAARALVRDLGTAARWTTMSLAVWNPWTFERLAVGQWPMLFGLAGLLWVVAGATTVRGDRDRVPLPVLLGLVLAGAASPPSGLTAAVVAVVLLVGRLRRTHLLALLGTCVAANTAWFVPALLAGAGLEASADQFLAFAVRAESAAGVLVSTLSGGGVWKTSIVPGERTSVLVAVTTAALAVAAVVVLWRSRGAPRTARRTVLCGTLALVAVALGAIPGVATVLGEAAGQLPALGLFRDTHRWLAPWLVAVVWGSGLGVQRLWEAGVARSESGLRILARCGPVLPLALLPSFGWGMGGNLHPVHYPAEWEQVRALPAATTVVLPWHGTYRGFAWNDRRAVLDPAPRLLPGTVLIDDRHFLDRGLVLGSEDAALARIEEALGAPDSAAALRALGVRRVLVHHGNGVTDDEVPTGTVLHSGATLTLIDLGPGATWTRVAPARGLVLAADVGALLVLAGLVAAAARSRRMESAGGRDFPTDGAGDD